MLSAAPLALTATVMGWGQPTIPGEIPASEPPPAVEQPAPAPPQVPVSSPPHFVYNRTPAVPAPAPPVYVDAYGGTEVRWYGWELILADFGSIMMLAKGGTPGLVVGMGGLALGAPALHFANHNYGTGAASLAVRGGLFLLLGLIAADQPSPCDAMKDPLCPADQVGGAFVDAGLVLGLAVGGLVFAIVDDTLLAHVTVPRRPAPGVTPYLAPQSGGAAMGLSGRF